MRTDSRRLRFPLQVALVTASLLAASPASTSAQIPASNFQELALRVKAGDTVYITDEIGKGEEKARVLELTPLLLKVSVDGVHRELGETQVSRIRQRLPDSRKNGALIGFLVGAVGWVGLAVGLASPSGSCHAGCAAAAALGGGGIGALVGSGIDGRVKGRKDIYVKADRQLSLRVDARPPASWQAQGVRMVFRF